LHDTTNVDGKKNPKHESFSNAAVVSYGNLKQRSHGESARYSPEIRSMQKDGVCVGSRKSNQLLHKVKTGTDLSGTTQNRIFSMKVVVAGATGTNGRQAMLRPLPRNAAG
jgi:hypothetical protein